MPSAPASDVPTTSCPARSALTAHTAIPLLPIQQYGCRHTAIRPQTYGNTRNRHVNRAPKNLGTGRPYLHVCFFYRVRGPSCIRTANAVQNRTILHRKTKTTRLSGAKGGINAPHALNIKAARCKRRPGCTGRAEHRAAEARRQTQKDGNSSRSTVR